MLTDREGLCGGSVEGGWKKPECGGRVEGCIGMVEGGWLEGGGRMDGEWMEGGRREDGGSVE